ncbi:MAG: L-threonylcarbamoyladenylate synthase [Caldilineaceae bacterium]
MTLTKIVPITSKDAIDTALVALAANTAIVAPTDTVYGIMCLYNEAAAIAHLYAAKDRPPMKAIPVLIGATIQLPLLTPEPIAPMASALMEAFWPGALTIVLPALPLLPTVLTAGQPTVGVRMPNHTELLALLRQSGPLAATSANRSGGPETHTTAEVMDQLGGRFPLLLSDPALDAAPHLDAQASTVIAIADATDSIPRILRSGPIAAAVCAFLATHFGVQCSLA